MDETRTRRNIIMAAVCVVIVAATWWVFTASYTRTATIAITATYPSDEADDPNAANATLRGTGIDLSGYDPGPQVSERLAHQRGGSAADYSDAVSIAPTDDGLARLAVTARARSEDETAELANQAAEIVVELFNALPSPADVVFRADVIEPAG